MLGSTRRHRYRQSFLTSRTRGEVAPQLSVQGQNTYQAVSQLIFRGVKLKESERGVFFVMTGKTLQESQEFLDKGDFGPSSPNIRPRQPHAAPQGVARGGITPNSRNAFLPTVPTRSHLNKVGMPSKVITRRRLKQVAVTDHSARTLARPRSRKCPDSKFRFTCPNTCSTFSPRRAYNAWPRWL